MNILDPIQNNHSLTWWLTGLSGAGKTTPAEISDSKSNIHLK
nr:hypothetical protein [uncultured Undibacterium sp.]